MAEQWMRPVAAAKELGVTRQMVYDLIHRDRIHWVTAYTPPESGRYLVDVLSWDRSNKGGKKRTMQTKPPPAAWPELRWFIAQLPPFDPTWSAAVGEAWWHCWDRLWHAAETGD